MEIRSVVNEIYSHIEPMQEVELQPVPISFDDVLKRYMDFQIREDFKTKAKYNTLAKLYARDIRYKEMELGLSYRVWSEEVLYKFETEFANKYLKGLKIF